MPPLPARPEQDSSVRAAARARRPGRLVALVCVVGVALTVSASLAAARADRTTEERLLEVQTEQAAAVLTVAIRAVEAPLRSALDVDRASGGGERGRAAVAEQIGRDVAADPAYLSASLWRTGPDGFTRDLALGDRPGLRPQDPQTQDLLDRALAGDTTAVLQADVDGRPLIAYALGDRRAGTVVHVERALPADRRAPVDTDSAYAGLSYAIYLGRTTSAEDMTATNVDPATLPLDDDVTYRTTLPFGDTALTVVTTPRTHLGSELSQRLPWLLLVGGLLLTGLAGLVAVKLTRARTTAEADTATIRDLYERVDTVFGEQRELFVALQRALLPPADPHIPQLEVAAEYVAGAIGIDIGGDWYSVLRLDEDRFAFVVGDVSGRGVEAVAEMARARFTLRAYLVDGDSPARALTKCARQFDVVDDGHIITALVAVGSHRTGTVTVADAGHPPPLLVGADGPAFVTVPVGPPLGLGPSAYDETTFALPDRATLVCYTDGLVERRGEDIDTGLDRLASVVAPLGERPLPELIAEVLAEMRDDGAPDDTAVLALRRVAPAVVGAGADPAPARDAPVPTP
ncbi:PP2C family protein-serine/threonine phosphatase [Nocardioides abyssi]|uniref:PP2C family protein-serine/threonine phosphatase n=1 Tax=Nocardioides abyssi TaxID=3058370 RepID=A0ABT8EYV9_9ACTN|nr:PP2C family protein-serine/threonine phosphatase [Nocardioides abyssi]MDN4163375.1 PP2C family protein-serine/threonine phosphatase [Nocardioides abyssi]